MDSYRPSTDRRRAVPSRDSYRPRRYDVRDGEQSWPPRDTNDDMFYFTAGQGRDRNFRDEPANRSRTRYQRQNDRSRDRARRMHRAPFSFKISERPLLRMEQDSAEDPSLLQNGAGVKFRAIDELTDSEEEEMAQSEDEEQGRAKRMRTQCVDAELAPAPRWSNPDPYTSLPPVQPGDPVKRTDVLRLIRKARLDADSSTKLTAEADDYISFDMDGGESEASLDMGNILTLPQSTTDAPKRSVTSGNSVALGKRKRGDEAGDKAQQKPVQPSLYSDKWVIPKWIAPADENAAPWFTMHDRSVLPGLM